MLSFQLETGAREAMIDVTGRLEELLRESGARSGLLTAYTPHTTTGLTINEGADPDVRRDILAEATRENDIDAPGFCRGRFARAAGASRRLDTRGGINQG